MDNTTYDGVNLTQSSTVEPPIMESLRYTDRLYTTDKPRPLIDFATEIIHFQPLRDAWTTSYLRTTDRTCAPKGQLAVQIASKSG